MHSLNIKRNPSNKSPTAIVDFKSGESGESPGGFQRAILDNRMSDPHGQSRFSTQSYKTGISKRTSSKNLNQYGFGNSFYQKYQVKIKTKKNPRVILRYLQVQINDMCGKLMETAGSNEIMKNELYRLNRKILFNFNFY